MKAWAFGCSWLERRESARRDRSGEREEGLPAQTRIALVKQSSYCDLYTDPSAESPGELLASSIHRTGPMGLFLRFATDFFIVHPEPDPECRVWEEKLAYEQPGGERAVRFPQLRRLQAERAVSADSIDWSVYDWVIALENAVPGRITRQHPGTHWSTLLEHHRMRPYRRYLRKVPEGYDSFLNLRYGPTPQSILQGPHTIDFPYGLNFAGGLREIHRDLVPERQRVMLEDHQESPELGAALAAHGVQVHVGGASGGSLAAYHQRLASSRILLAPRSRRPLGGLAAIDAASLGCLVVGNRSQMWNPFLILPELDCRDEKTALRLTLELLEDDARFNRCLAAQNARLDWFCWNRPLGQVAQLLGGKAGIR